MAAATHRFHARHPTHRGRGVFLVDALAAAIPDVDPDADPDEDEDADRRGAADLDRARLPTFLLLSRWLSPSFGLAVPPPLPCGPFFGSLGGRSPSSSFLVLPASMRTFPRASVALLVSFALGLASPTGVLSSFGSLIVACLWIDNGTEWNGMEWNGSDEFSCRVCGPKKKGSSEDRGMEKQERLAASFCVQMSFAF